MTNSNRAVRGFRPGSKFNPKTPHHALQKHDRLTRYGQGEGEGAIVFAKACEMGLEEIVSKRVGNLRA